MSSNRKTTKRALLGTVVSLVLCMCMLIGTTFAWFTDSKTTQVNTIQSGILTIDIQDKDGNSLVDKTMDFVKAEGHEDEKILWEPGCTYNLQDFKVVNTGNLALKFKFLVNGINGDAKLNKAIEWTIGGKSIDETEISLLPGEETELFTVSGHMKEEAGNEYQNLTIDGAAITVLATQDTVEYDSIDNQYDKLAKFADETSWYEKDAEEYHLKNASQLLGLAQRINCGENFAGKTVYLDADIDLKDIEWPGMHPAYGSMPNIDGQGHKIKNMTCDGVSKVGFITEAACNFTMKDVTFDNANVTASGSYVGVVMGYQYGKVVLDNVKVIDSKLTGTGAISCNIGSLVGYTCQNDDAVLTLKNCAADDVTLEGYHGIGGLVGVTKTAKNSQFFVDDCAVTNCSINYRATGGVGGHIVGAGADGYQDAHYQGHGVTDQAGTTIKQK